MLGPGNRSMAELRKKSFTVVNGIVCLYRAICLKIALLWRANFRKHPAR